MFDQLTKRHSVGRPADRDIETPRQVIKGDRVKPDREAGPRTHSETQPWRVTWNQARALDAMVTYGNIHQAAIALGITEGSLYSRLAGAYPHIPGEHRLAKLIHWANARRIMEVAQ